MMARSKKLRVTVEEPLLEGIKGAAPFDMSATVGKKVVDVSVDKVKREIRKTLSTLQDVLSETAVVNKDYELKEVSFTLGLEASGGVSLLSVVSGNVATSSGFQVTFTRRDAE